MSPLPYVGTREQSKSRIIHLLNSMNRARVVEVSDFAIHATFKTRLFRFVDDVVFHFDDTGRQIHYRSASRVGYYDFGVNRRRIEKIRNSWDDGLQQ